jgi:hypothetical protein
MISEMRQVATDLLPRSPVNKQYFDNDSTVFGIEFTWQNKPAEVHAAVFEIFT